MLPWRLLVALLLGTATAVIMLCTCVPIPFMLMVPPSIGGTELAPHFLVAGLVVLALAAAPHAWRWARRISLGLGGVTVVLALVTLMRIPGAIADTEQAMRTAFGPAPAATYGRDAPLAWADLLRGIHVPPVTVEHGVVFNRSATEPLLADLYRPPGPGPHPVVVVIHGGSWSSGDRTDFTTCSQYLAAHGSLVMAIDYRLVPRHHFPDQLVDVREAMVWVRAHAAEYGGDAGRTVLLGRSAGSELALLTAYAHDADPGIRGVVAFYSPVDLTEGYIHPAKPDPLDSLAVFRAFIGGTPQEFPELYRAASPIEWATRPLPPTLLINGGRDNLVYIRFGRALADRLRAHGTHVALLDIPWAEHAFDIIPNGLGGQIALYHLERFLATVNAP